MLQYTGSGGYSKSYSACSLAASNTVREVATVKLAETLSSGIICTKYFAFLHRIIDI
jgi:hypothetical protein